MSPIETTELRSHQIRLLIYDVQNEKRVGSCNISAKAERKWRYSAWNKIYPTIIIYTRSNKIDIWHNAQSCSF